MPAALIRSLARKAKVTVAKAETKWDKAAKIVTDEYGISKKDSNFYAIATAIAKKLLHIKEDQRLGFKSFLTEMNYGSLVDERKYNQLDKADKALYVYTADGKTSLSGVMDTLMKRYPFEGGVIYRGLHFDTQEQHDEFLERIKGGKLAIEYFSSWTPSESTAEDFAHSKKTYFPSLAIMKAHQQMKDEGEHMSGYGGVVISTKVKEGEGVDVNLSDFAKESEVILPAGTYEVKVEKLIEPYKRQLKNIDDVKVLIGKFRSAKATTRELDDKIDFIKKNWLKKLDQQDVDALIQYQLMKFLKLTNEELTKFVDCKFRDDPIMKQYRLLVDIYVPVDKEIFELASEKLQKKILSKLKVIASTASKDIKQLLDSPDIDKVTDFRIEGVGMLRQFLPNETDKMVQPIRHILGKRYHQMNDRSHLKTVTNYDELRKFQDTVTSIVKAMQSI